MILTFTNRKQVLANLVSIRWFAQGAAIDKDINCPARWVFYKFPETLLGEIK